MGFNSKNFPFLNDCIALHIKDVRKGEKWKLLKLDQYQNIEFFKVSNPILCKISFLFPPIFAEQEIKLYFSTPIKFID